LDVVADGQSARFEERLTGTRDNPKRDPVLGVFEVNERRSRIEREGLVQQQPGFIQLHAPQPNHRPQRKRIRGESHRSFEGVDATRGRWGVTCDDITLSLDPIAVVVCAWTSSVCERSSAVFAKRVSLPSITAT
jgi:hypothetical protein